MNLIIILTCLLAERFLIEHQQWRQADWFFDYSRWYQRQTLPIWMQEGFAGVIGLLLPPILAVALFQQLFDGILGALFSGVVLLYCLGPRDLETEISQFSEARRQGDETRSRAIARDLLNDEPPASEPAYSQAVAEAIFEQSNRRLFAVLFWFLLLGPMGSALYRLACHLPRLPEASREVELLLTSQRLIAILDWAPARITAFAYAIAGSFEDALYGWRSYHERRFNEFSNSASGILICTGSGALRLTTLLEQAVSEDDYLYLAKAAMALVWRSLVVWLIVLALFTLLGWV